LDFRLHTNEFPTVSTLLAGDKRPSRLLFAGKNKLFAAFLFLFAANGVLFVRKQCLFAGMAMLFAK
jgi:hypothetical protein